MPNAFYVQLKGDDQLTDEISPGNKDYQKISIGNLSVYFERDTKTIAFGVSPDNMYPFDAVNRLRRILEYIETTYGS